MHTISTANHPDKYDVLPQTMIYLNDWILFGAS